MESINSKKGIEQRDEAREYISKKAITEEMTELKTLKDLHYISAAWDSLSEDEGSEWVNLKLLKAEAIKWVKYYSCEKQIKNKKKYRDFLVICKAKREVLIDFFNITEEDLK